VAPAGRPGTLGDFAAGRGLDRARSLRAPASPTDVAGLKVGAEDLLGAVLEAVGQPILVVGPEGLIRFANPAAAAALGYDRADELCGRHSHDAIRLRRRPVTSVPLEMADGRGAVVAFAADPEDRVAADRGTHEPAAQQAALRRVAMLVAGGVASPDAFAAIAKEVAQGLDAALVAIWRHEHGRPVTVLGAWCDRPHPFEAGSRWPVEACTAAGMLPRIGHPTRVEDFGAIGGAIPAAIRALGIRSGAGAAIVLDGELWGVMGVGLRPEGELLLDHIEDRVAEFTELVAAAISTVEARSEVAASRARIVAAADDERRRVVRDLHDGAQQRLVHTIITLKLARRALQEHPDAAPALVGDALHHAEQANVELRELAHGILPDVLIRGGLRAGVDALASRMPVPVDNEVAVGRLPSPVEATAYFVVAEALTNVAKHARADHAEVTARIEDGTLGIRVRDDGIGGARPDGNGLVGLADRLAVLHGELRVESPADGGTLVAAAIPVGG
jgi:signal transduction histidine kinase